MNTENVKQKEEPLVNSSKLGLVRGFKDYTGKEAEKRAVIREVIRNIFEKYNFEEAETPIIEYEEFVKENNPNDEAISDIFRLKDKGGRNLALRYEFTFQLKRIANNKKLPYRRFQIGPLFRDEPVGPNRFRQFTQCDVDIVGSTVKEEAEILAITKEILEKLKIDSIIYVNNRKLLNEILDEMKISEKEKVIKEIDKFGKIPEKEVRDNLKKYNAEKILEIITKKEDAFKNYRAYKEIDELKKACENYGVKVIFAPWLARGLSYYNGSVFEVKSKGMKETTCGGGSYLVEGVQSTGISFGLDRLEKVTNLLIKIDKFLVVSLNEDKKALALIKDLRKKGKIASIFYGKPSKALEYANSYGINNVIFVGEKEIKEKRFKIKDMKTGKEILLKI